MKRKYLSKKEWKRIIKTEEITEYIKQKDFIGNISLLKVIKIRQPLKNKFETNKIVMDNNYYWLTLLFDNKNYVITGQFNDQKELIQIYIDIIDGSGVENGELYYDDLYVDVILTSNQKVILDDIDELELAFKNQQITKKQYDKAYLTGYLIYKDLQNNPTK